ncbi:MAG: carboxypeptidase-like regulatory domain-containing protein [Clostridiales bacterium]|nr:carboxypeptidase-like regulatory domain-containing protein [Clostridiales bacterium]
MNKGTKAIAVILVILMMFAVFNLSANAYLPGYSHGVIPVEAGVASAVMQSDIDNKFSDYAEKGATIVYPERENGCNVVGVVVDFSKNQLVRGAKIYLNGQYIVSTGQDGRFQIKNLPEGVYDWEIRAVGYYKQAEYLNYSILHENGANIFTLFVDKQMDILLDQNG